MPFLSSKKQIALLIFTAIIAIVFYTPLVNFTKTALSSQQLFFTPSILQADKDKRETEPDQDDDEDNDEEDDEEDMTFIARNIVKIVSAFEQAEGAGARVRRSIGTMGMPNFTPFLMLDHFRVTPEAGFPDHPHRGQETITYMLKGKVDHEDFTGSAGTLEPGDLQFMTAGRGIVHAEMPRINKTEDGDLDAIEGLQLWVDLPEKLKECEPRYRDLRKDEIPVINPDPNVQIKVISGNSYGTESLKDLAYTPVWLFDMTVKPGGEVTQPIPHGFNTFIYIMDGQIKIGDKKISKHASVFFEKEGDGIELSVPDDAKDDARFAVIAGKVLDQPIVQHGPFVETSRDRIYKAFADYQMRTNGFERAAGWKSKIGQRMRRD